MKIKMKQLMTFTLSFILSHGFYLSAHAGPVGSSVDSCKAMVQSKINACSQAVQGAQSATNASGEMQLAAAQNSSADGMEGAARQLDSVSSAGADVWGSAIAYCQQKLEECGKPCGPNATLTPKTQGELCDRGIASLLTVATSAQQSNLAAAAQAQSAVSATTVSSGICNARFFPDGMLSSPWVCMSNPMISSPERDSCEVRCLGSMGRTRSM